MYSALTVDAILSAVCSMVEYLVSFSLTLSGVSYAPTTRPLTYSLVTVALMASEVCETVEYSLRRSSSCFAEVYVAESVRENCSSASVRSLS